MLYQAALPLELGQHRCLVPKVRARIHRLAVQAHGLRLRTSLLLLLLLLSGHFLLRMLLFSLFFLLLLLVLLMLLNMRLPTQLLLLLLRGRSRWCRRCVLGQQSAVPEDGVHKLRAQHVGHVEPRRQLLSDGGLACAGAHSKPGVH